MKEMIERAEKLAKSINEAHWCTDGLSFEEVISRLILRELQEERKMAVDKACLAFCEHTCMCSKPCSRPCEAIQNVRKAMEE